MIKKWKILDSKVRFSSKFVTVREEKLLRPDGKVASPYYAIERPNAVQIVPVTRDRKLILIREYKNGLKDLTWSIPAGFIDRKESAVEAAKRELLEETGIAAEKFIRLGGFNSGAGVQRNTEYYFLAKNVSKVSKQNLDEFEEIEVETFNFDDIVQDIKMRKSFLPQTQSQLAILLASEII